MSTRAAPSLITCAAATATGAPSRCDLGHRVVSDVLELTRGERAYLVARTQRKKLGLRGPSVTSRTNGTRYGPSCIASAGPHDGSTKMPSDLALRVERVTRIELA